MLTGFARSFGMRLFDGRRKEWVKPIMFSGGMGSLSEEHVRKTEPEKGKLEIIYISNLNHHFPLRDSFCMVHVTHRAMKDPIIVCLVFNDRNGGCKSRRSSV